MTEAPNDGGQVTAAQLGAGVQPDTGADTAEAQGASPADDGDAERRRIAAKEKREGKKAGMAEALEALGFEDLDSATQWVSEYRTIEQEMESEADREKAAREKAEAEANQYRTRYEFTEKRYAIRDALRDAGVPSDRLSDALALIKLDDVALDRKTGEISGVSEAVEALLEPRPWLMETEAQAQRVSAPVNQTGASRPAETPQSSGDVNTDMGRGMLDWLTGPVEEQQQWP